MDSYLIIIAIQFISKILKKHDKKIKIENEKCLKLNNFYLHQGKSKINFDRCSYVGR